MCQINLNQTQLLPIQENQIGDDLYYTVNARDLHQFLEVGKDFSTWIKDRIERYNLIENQDFRIFPNSGEKSNGLFSRGRPATEYILTLDTAKDIALMENNTQGQQVRQYFKNFEAKGRKVFTELQTTINQQRTQLANLSDVLLNQNPMLDKIHRYTQIGLNQKEIAKLTDISVPTISKHQHTLAKVGIIDPPQKVALTAVSFTINQLNDMMQRREQGQSYKTIGQAYGCSADTIKRRISGQR